MATINSTNENPAAALLFRFCGMELDPLFLTLAYLNMLDWNVDGNAGTCNDTSTVKRRTPAGWFGTFCSIIQRRENVSVSGVGTGAVAEGTLCMLPSGA
jgi:hypothetical protein